MLSFEPSPRWAKFSPEGQSTFLHRSRRWAEYTTNSMCDVNSGSLFDSAFTTSNGCVAGENCGDYTAAFYTCPASNEEATTTKGSDYISVSSY